MSNLHNIVRHTYKSIFKLFGLEVETENGWNSIKTLNITFPTEAIIIHTEHHDIICSKNHILIEKDGNEILAKDSNQKFIKVKSGVERVIHIEETNSQVLYDLTLDNNTNHLYYSNEILSHNCVIADEFSFVQNNIASKVFESIYPVISSSKNSQFIIVSTPNGADTRNLYYDIWLKANAKESAKNTEGWKPFRFDWWDVPGRDEQWKINTIASIGKQRFDQEFGNEFITSDNIKKLIPDDILERYRMKLTEYKNVGIKPKKQKIVSQDESEIFEFDMWHEFNPQNTYAASMDIAEGVGKDASVLYIWDVTDLRDVKMCAKFSSSTISLVQFAYVARKMLKLYNDPYLAAERNGVSAGTLDSLKITYNYQNIVSENKHNEAGIYSHVTVKEKACIWARQMLMTAGFGFTIYDKELIDEFSIFCKKDTKGVHLVYQALPGPSSHDDHVMAFIWMTYILSKEVIDRYFNVCMEFTDQFENILPRLLQPMNEYSPDSLKQIADDPLYKEFLDFKKEMNEELRKKMEAEQEEVDNDVFQYRKMSNDDDPYFEDSWSDRIWQKSGNKPNFGKMPVFFI